MRNFLTVIIFFLVFIPSAYCQEREDSLTSAGNVYLSLKNLNFVKDNEYYNPIIEGYTLIGYIIQPAIVYMPSEKLRIKLGTHILNYAGAGKINQAKLVLSTTYKFSESTSLTLGTLNGSDKHRMFDPHFDFERLYKLYAEDGFQMVTETEHIFSDNWLSWENFIFKGDTTREVFTMGESFRYTSGKNGTAFNYEIPVQIQFKHYGGQISNYSQHIQTFLNVAAGLRINYDIDQGRLGTAGFEYLQFINKELIKRGINGVIKGNASWFRFHYNYKAVYFGSYYWKSHNFYAPDGNGIYSSVSSRDVVVVIPDRKIWTNSLYLTFHPLNFLEIFLGIDAYYDLNLKRIDPAMTLHMNFEKLIRIASLKK
jgi:hypothetical protein